MIPYAEIIVSIIIETNLLSKPNGGYKLKKTKDEFSGEERRSGEDRRRTIAFYDGEERRFTADRRSDKERRSSEDRRKPS